MLSNWKVYSKLLAQGGGTSRNIFVIFIGTGCTAIIARLCQPDQGATLPTTMEHKQGPSRKLIKQPLVRVLLVLIIGGLFLPAHPWRRMASTLLFDVFATILSVVLTKHIRNIKAQSTNSNFGSNPLGNLNYNPANDPYYISNLDQPIDDVIAQAIEGLEFTNVVHIVLESMRADSYPFKENSLLANHADQNFEKPSYSVPITTSNISPFIASLAEHTISWETMWATIPFTHKAMLGRIYSLPQIINARLLRPTCPTNRLERRIRVPSKIIPTLSPTSASRYQRRHQNRPFTPRYSTQWYSSIDDRYMGNCIH